MKLPISILIVFLLAGVTASAKDDITKELITSNGKTLSSTGTADGARTGASVFVSGDWESMALYLGSGIAKRKGVPRHGRASSRPSTSFLLKCQDVDARHKAGHDKLHHKAPFHRLFFESDSDRKYCR